MDNQSLAHSKWNCKYHIVFAPKYRRYALIGLIVNISMGKVLKRYFENHEITVLQLAVANVLKKEKW